MNLQYPVTDRIPSSSDLMIGFYLCRLHNFFATRSSSGASPESPARSVQRNSTEGLSLRSCGSGDVHTAHSQARVGTPIEVPVPRNVSVACIEFVGGES